MPLSPKGENGEELSEDCSEGDPTYPPLEGREKHEILAKMKAQDGELGQRRKEPVF